MLWTLHEIQKALSLKVEGENVDISGISIDTRTLQKGDLFVALKAERDGHDFVKTAIQKGASACLVSEKVDANIPLLIVKDTLNSLTTLAKNRVENHTGKRIAITGSSGKTSLTNMLATISDAHKPEKSYNNHWGVPLTLCRMAKQKHVSVIEIGTNHIGEIKPLVDLVKPNIAVITNIAPAHIGNFVDLDELADEKLSIQNGLTKNGILVLPQQVYAKYKHKITSKTITFSLADNADIYLLENINNNLKIATPNGNIIVKLNMIGEHHILNALATVGVLYGLNLSYKLMENISKVSELTGRGKIYKLKNITIIDDSFNANPLSMEMALTTLQKYKTSGRKIAILGDMLEMGKDTEKYHKDLIKNIKNIDKIITVGENMKFLYQQLPDSIKLGHYETVKDIDIKQIISQFNKGDVVLIKASKGVFWVENFVEKLLLKLNKEEEY